MIGGERYEVRLASRDGEGASPGGQVAGARAGAESPRDLCRRGPDGRAGEPLEAGHRLCGHVAGHARGADRRRPNPHASSTGRHPRRYCLRRARGGCDSQRGALRAEGPRGRRREPRGLARGKQQPRGGVNQVYTSPNQTVRHPGDGFHRHVPGEQSLPYDWNLRGYTRDGSGGGGDEPPDGPGVAHRGREGKDGLEHDGQRSHPQAEHHRRHRRRLDPLQRWLVSQISHGLDGQQVYLWSARP